MSSVQSTTPRTASEDLPILLVDERSGSVNGSPFPQPYTPRSSVGNSVPDTDHSAPSATIRKANECGGTISNIRLGFCCMAKKMNQPTMKALQDRFLGFGNFELVLFDENMILNDEITKWPTVDCMIAFNSGGFPLDKAIKYAQMHPHTFYLTHPESQRVLLDRRKFYSALRRNNIPISRHVFCSRDGFEGEPEPVIEEHLDFIVVNGVRMDKPFVEKPADSEDHNLRLYYHSRDGGGCREMFRKVKDQSSAYHPDITTIRRDGSYIYEEYIECIDKRDVKCYTVGPNYVHAEARKAPTDDGIVLRDESGKEMREEVTLTPAEMMVARKVCKVFRQLVCGFDILRADGGHFYVCDVNGWSFVKNNAAYVEKASSIMRDIFEEKVRERGLHRKVNVHERRSLCGVIAVARHADRTPKQKVKLFVAFEVFRTNVFAGQTKVTEEVVIKGKNPLIAEVKEQVDRMLADSEAHGTPADGTPSSPLLSSRPADNVHQKAVHSLRLMHDVLQRNNEGLKFQLKPCKWDEEGNCVEVQLVCKWGGWLTEAGALQAKMLGEHFANRIYTRTDVRHVTKERVSITVNNERRVLHTAVEFTRAFLKDTSITEKDAVVDEGLLGDSFQAKDIMLDMTRRIENLLHVDSVEALGKDAYLPGMQGILNCVALDASSRTPLGALQTMHVLLHELIDHIPEEAALYRGESIFLMKQRWENIASAFYRSKTKTYDTSKIPDIFDSVSYDCLYNQQALAPLDLYPLFTLAEALSLFVSAGEYGFLSHERKFTGGMIAAPLFSRIAHDIDEIAKGKGALSRLYFTSESHLMGLKNLLYECNSATFHRLEDPMELHFLSHFVFKVYCYPGREQGSCIQVEVHFSPGMDKNMFGINQDHHVEYASVSPMIRIHNDLGHDDVRAIDAEYSTFFDHYRVDKMAAKHLMVRSTEQEEALAALATPSRALHQPPLQTPKLSQDDMLKGAGSSASNDADPCGCILSKAV